MVVDSIGNSATMQKISSRMGGDEVDRAIVYYCLLLKAINNMPVTRRDVQLLAFIAVKGSIYSAGKREEFMRRFSTGQSRHLVTMMVYRLRKMGLLTKENGKISLAGPLRLNFSRKLMLEITLN